MPNLFIFASCLDLQWGWSSAGAMGRRRTSQGHQDSQGGCLAAVLSQGALEEPYSQDLCCLCCQEQDLPTSRGLGTVPEQGSCTCRRKGKVQVILRVCP